MRLLALLCLLLVGACSSGPTKRRIPPRFSVEEVPGAIEASAQDLEAGRYEKALERLRSAKNTPGLPAQLRQEVQVALEGAAEKVISHSEDYHALEELTDVDIPRVLAVEAGIRAARLLFAEGERMRAFRLLRRLDGKFPRHPRRMQAASLLFEIGKDLANDDGRYMLIFKYKSNAPQVLEYLVMNHPSAPEGAEALFILSQLYQESHRYELAIEKNQDLILWFPDSPYVVRAQAAIPHLRLVRLRSPEYDRSELQRARRELETWLEEHQASAEASLVDEVRRDRLDALRRLADNDLVVARFYRRVKDPAGATYHGERALELARLGGDDEQVEEVRAFLESLPVATPASGGAEIP